MYDPYEYYHINSKNYSSQILHAKGQKYISKESKKYVYHLNNIYPDEVDMGSKLISSHREFHNSFTKKETLFSILHRSYLIDKDKNKSLFTPSAGALYPIELYIFVMNIENVNKGIYHYDREKGFLSFISNLNLDFLPPNNLFVSESSFIVVLTAWTKDLISKYGPRGYRYSLIECGHIGQNLHTNSKDLGIGCCPIAGFYDDKVSSILQIPDNEVPLYAYCFGNITKGSDNYERVF